MNIYTMNLSSKSNHQNMFTHFIRDVSFIVTFGDFWHSQLSILSRDADMVQQTCIWLCGPSDLDPDSNLLHQECFMHYCRPSQFMFVLNKVCSQPWIIAIEGMEFFFLCHLMFSYNHLINF